MAKKANAKAAKKAAKKSAKKTVKKTAKKSAKKAAKKAVKKAVKAKKAPKRPPYKCQRTLDPGICLKFRYNPSNGKYDLGGDEVPCSSCEYFM